MPNSFINIDIIYPGYFFVLVKFTFFDLFCNQNLCSFHLFLNTLKKKNFKKFYNNLGMPAVIIYFALDKMI